MVDYILLSLLILLYVVLGWLFNSWAFIGDIKKFRWLLSQASEIYTLYKLLVVLTCIIIFVLFSPVFIIGLTLSIILGYFKRRKIIRQIDTLEKVLGK